LTGCTILPIGAGHTGDSLFTFEVLGYLFIAGSVRIGFGIGSIGRHLHCLTLFLGGVH
jgi:hypothetical protein